MNVININSIEKYIQSSVPEVRKRLQVLRSTVKKIAPTAEETIKYGIPTFVYKGKNLVHFAAAKAHIGWYPAPSAIVKFSQKLKPYKTSKGAVQFPLDTPLPVELVAEMTKYRVQEIDRSLKES